MSKVDTLAINQVEEDWDTVITSKNPLLDFRFKEVWQYRDLLVLMVRRDIAQIYKQTILGPVWFFIQPILTSGVFTLVFGNMAEIPTDGIPPLLFYLAGITFWNFFQESLVKSSAVFRDNAHIFGKVYFCRLVVPLSIVANNLVKFTIQFIVFIVAFIYFLITNDYIQPNLHALLLPLLIVMTALSALGFGLIFTAATAKYRDLYFLLTFGIQLWMFVTPVIYPLSEVPEEYRIYALMNPMASIIETFKFGFLGVGTFSWVYLIIGFISMFIFLLIGIVSFNRTEKSFIDTV